MTPEQIVEIAAPRTSAVMPTRPFVQALIERTGGADLEAAVLLAADSYKRNEVVALMVAAVASGRPCSARTVGRLLWFLPTPLFGVVLMHAEGDRVAAISAALECGIGWVKSTEDVGVAMRGASCQPPFACTVARCGGSHSPRHWHSPRAARAHGRAHRS